MYYFTFLSHVLCGIVTAVWGWRINTAFSLSFSQWYFSMSLNYKVSYVGSAQ